MYYIATVLYLTITVLDIYSYVQIAILIHCLTGHQDQMELGTSSDFALVRKAGSFQKGAWAIAEEEDVSKPLSMK